MLGKFCLAWFGLKCDSLEVCRSASIANVTPSTLMKLCMYFGGSYRISIVDVYNYYSLNWRWVSNIDHFFRIYCNNKLIRRLKFFSYLYHGFVYILLWSSEKFEYLEFFFVFFCNLSLLFLRCLCCKTPIYRARIYRA